MVLIRRFSIGLTIHLVKFKKKTCLEWPVCEVGKIIDLLHIHGKILIHKLRDLSQVFSVPLVCFWIGLDLISLEIVYILFRVSRIKVLRPQTKGTPKIIKNLNFPPTVFVWIWLNYTIYKFYFKWSLINVCQIYLMFIFISFCLHSIFNFHRKIH
jgi:hypothetical protein